MKVLSDIISSLDSTLLLDRANHNTLLHRCVFLIAWATGQRIICFFAERLYSTRMFVSVQFSPVGDLLWFTLRFTAFNSALHLVYSRSTSTNPAVSIRLPRLCCWYPNLRLFYPSEVGRLANKVSACINKVSAWMKSWWLQLIAEVLWFSSARRQHRNQTSPLHVSNDSVIPVSLVRDLDVHLDSSVG